MTSSNDGILVSSIPDPSLSWEECDATILYELKDDQSLIKHQRDSSIKLNRMIPEKDTVEDIPSDILDQFRKILTQVVDRRVRSIPTHKETGSSLRECKVAVLFSGGIDCTMGKTAVSSISII